MANERVSQLQDLFASDTQPNDLLLVTDMSQMESKRMEVGELLNYIQSSGSFSAYHSNTADTASYVNSSNIDGIIAEASLSTQSLSASSALTSISSSYSLNAGTASYSQFCLISQDTANSASYLIYLGTPNGTASYSMLSNTSNTANTALNLFYNGTPNGTASFAITTSFSKSSSYATQSTHADTASLAVTTSYSYFTDTAANASTASVAGTSSYANTASYISNTFYGPKFITPILIAGSTAKIDWTQYNCPTEFIPIGTNVIIVDAYSSNGTTNLPGFVQISQQSSTTSSAAYIVTAYRTAGSGDNCTFGGQASGPCSSSSANSSSFFYTFTGAADGGTVLRLIGYY
jgi:hypothetical protein